MTIDNMQDKIVEINGIKISGTVIPYIISCLTNPNEGMWYRFERDGDQIIVHQKPMEE